MTKDTNNVATSKNDDMKASPNVAGMVQGGGPVSALSDSLSKDNRVDVIAGVVDSSSMSLSENVDATVTTVVNNVATSKNEGFKATPNVSNKVEGVGSLSNTLPEYNKEDGKAEGVDLPSVVLTSDKQVKNCVN
jgi:hypothetical protein